MNINKALKTEYYRPHQLIKHEHICIYLFINCFWIDIWITSLLNWYLCTFSCCHLHHKTPSNFEHLETSPVFAIPTSPSKPQKYYAWDCVRLQQHHREEKQALLWGRAVWRAWITEDIYYMRYLSQTPKEVKESWHSSDKRIRGGKKVASSSKILRQEHGIIVDK